MPTYRVTLPTTILLERPTLVVFADNNTAAIDAVKQATGRTPVSAIETSASIELPGDPACPRCGGAGLDPQRWELWSGHGLGCLRQHEASGSLAAVEAVAGTVWHAGRWAHIAVLRAECAWCKGEGTPRLALTIAEPEPRSKSITAEDRASIVSDALAAWAAGASSIAAALEFAIGCHGYAPQNEPVLCLLLADAHRQATAARE